MYFSVVQMYLSAANVYLSLLPKYISPCCSDVYQCCQQVSKCVVHSHVLLTCTLVLLRGSEETEEASSWIFLPFLFLPAAPAGTRTRDLSITSPALCHRAVRAPSTTCYMY